MMKCRRTQNLLSAYLDEELDLRQRQAVDAHLPKCSACRRLLNELRSTVQLIGDLPKERAPEDLMVTIQEATERASLLADTPEDDRDWKSDIPFADPSPRRQWPHTAPITRILTAAAAILAAVGLGIWIGHFASRSGGVVDPPHSQYAAAPAPADAPESERPDRSNKNALASGRRKREFAEATGSKAAGEFGGVDKKQTGVLQRKAVVAPADAAQYFIIDVADRETAVRMLRNLVVLANGRKDAVVLEAATYSGENLKEARGKYEFAKRRVEKGVTVKAGEADKVCVVNLSEHRVASFLKVLDKTVGLRLARAEEKVLRSMPMDKDGAVASGRLALVPSSETASPGSGIQSPAAKPESRLDKPLTDQRHQRGTSVATPAPVPVRPELAPMPAAPTLAPAPAPTQSSSSGLAPPAPLVVARPSKRPVAHGTSRSTGQTVDLKAETCPVEAGGDADVSTAKTDIVVVKQRATTRPAASDEKVGSTRPAERTVRLIFTLRTPKSSELGVGSSE